MVVGSPLAEWDTYEDGVIGDQPSLVFARCPHGCGTTVVFAPAAIPEGVHEIYCDHCGKRIPIWMLLPDDGAWAPEWLAAQRELHQIWRDHWRERFEAMPMTWD